MLPSVVILVQQLLLLLPLSTAGVFIIIYENGNKPCLLYCCTCSPSTHMEPDKDETLAYTHKVIGTIAFSFLLLQVRTQLGLSVGVTD